LKIVGHGSSLVLSEMSIYGNIVKGRLQASIWGGNGGGLLLKGVHTTMNDSSIFDNEALNMSGGVHIYTNFFHNDTLESEPVDVTIVRSRIYSNKANRGGGLTCCDSTAAAGVRPQLGTFTVESTEIYLNVANGSYGVDAESGGDLSQHLMNMDYITGVHDNPDHEHTIGTTYDTRVPHSRQPASPFLLFAPNCC
jgi:hypothetical protein